MGKNVKDCPYLFVFFDLYSISSESEDVMVESSESLYTTAEAARICGVHPRTIKRWHERGILHPIHPGGTVRWRREEVHKLAKNHRPWERWNTKSDPDAARKNRQTGVIETLLTR